MLLRRIARPMLAALFIQGGISALKAPQGHVQAAKPVLDAVSPAVDKVVEIAPIDQRPDDEMLVRIDAGVKIVAGSMLAFGKFPRLASTALAASLIPTTLAGHRFWEETDEAKKAEQQIHFFKNVGLLGGLLIAAADTHGKPSAAWRTRKAAEQAQKKLSGA
ncbi:MAG: DoxX family protein, partial [Acidimicrobiales bacterium]|nr:DoxX family protein [Acidimicrobiales bacterium]